MHKHLLHKLVFPCTVLAATGTAQAKDITKDTEYTSAPSATLEVKNNAKLTLALNSNAVLDKNIVANPGTTIQFRNTSTNQDITYSLNDQTDATLIVGEIWGSLIIGSAIDSHNTVLNFKSSAYTFKLQQDLIVYGNSQLITGASLSSYSGIEGSLRCLHNASSITLQEASSGPTIAASLSLESLDSLTLEQSINLAKHNIKLAAPSEHIIQLTLAPDLITSVAGEKSFTLFTNVNGLLITGNELIAQPNNQEFNASDYFTSSYIDENTKLVWNKDGSLILTGLVDVIPEPSTASLSLLALLGLALRRRRA